MKESKEYPKVIGKCPITDVPCEVVNSISSAKKEYGKLKTIHQNESYKHLVTLDGIHLIYKRKIRR